MRVFVTGASGWIGSAVVADLIDAGHEVTGLARSDASATAVQDAGAEVVRGSLDDLDTLSRAAGAADGVIHTAYIHDFSQMEAAAAADRRVIETLGTPLAGSDRPLVVTTGTGVLHPGHPVIEDDRHDPSTPGHPRRENESVALGLAERGVRVSIVRPAPSVHGEGAGRDADVTVGLISERGGEAVADYGDVADHEQAGHLIDTAVTRWGQLDILVNNAGIVRDAAIWNMKPDDFDAVIRVHLRGTWSCSHHGAVHWRNRAKSGDRVIGRIINTTSGAGLTGNFGQTAYASA